MADSRKQSLYFPDDMLAEVETEALRTDRSKSWLMQQAWKIARPTIARLASADGSTPAPPVQ